MTPRARWSILGFALLGLGFASMATWVHYRLLTDPSYVPSCDINTTFNCTQAYLSRFGSAFGVPVALGGVAWFALVALIAAFAKPDQPGAAPSSAAGSYVFGLATIGLAAILYLAYASFFELKTYCVLCMGTYVSVIGIFITSGLTSSVAMSRIPSRIVGDLRSVLRRPAMLTIALLYIVAAASGVAWFPREMKAPQAPPAAPPIDEEERFRQAWERQPQIDLGIDKGTAKVVVVKFNDWLCPSCKAWAKYYQPILDEFEKEQPGALKIVIKDWPWNSQCNVNVPQTFLGHEGSCDAAVAVRLARRQSPAKEKAMEDWLFDNQESLAEQGRAGKGAASKAIRDKAAEMLGVKDFDREYLSILAEIRRDVADGQALYIEATPTYFVNGVRTTTQRTPGDQGGQNLPPQLFQLGIKIELQKNGGKK